MSYDDRSEAELVREPEPDDFRAPDNGPVPRRSRRRRLHETTAFGHLYREHFALVWSVTRRARIDPAQRDDVVQEVWLTAYRRLHTLQPDASVKAWLASITRHVASRHHRTDSRRRRKIAALAELPTPSQEGTLDPHDARQLVKALLNRLDPEQREVLVLSQVHGLTGPELAEALGVGLNTVYSRLRLARRRVERLADTLGVEQAALLKPLREQEQPPPAAAAHAWVILAPKLGSAGTPLAAGVATGAAKLSSLALAKAATVTLGISLAGVGAVRMTADLGSRPVTVDTHRQVRDAKKVVASVEASPALMTAVQPAVFASPPREPDSAALVSAQPKSAPTVRRPEVAHRSKTKPSDVTASKAMGSTLAEESALLQKAQIALRRGDAQMALRVLDEHERRFARGDLTDERRSVRIRALCQQGKHAQARSEAQRLVAKRPNSVAAARMANGCGS